MEFATKCVHAIGEADATGSITPAIYLSSTFAHPRLGESTGFAYTRESNSTMEISDLRAISKIAKEHDFLVIVDNTFWTPYFQKPLELGADIVIHSGTKYLTGHNDVLCGFTVAKDQEIADKLRLIFKTTGAVLGALDAWLDGGGIFGAEGEPFERINVACPRATLVQGLEQLKQAVEGLQQASTKA